MRNPLIKRIPKELKSDWHKYIVILIFMVMMIGVISGMYVGHDSMLDAIYSNRDVLNLEDGSFELKKEASSEFIEDISTGTMADVREYLIQKGINEAKEQGYDIPYDVVAEEVDKEWNKVVERYSLDDEDFKAVEIKVYENFFHDEEEDFDCDGVEDATVRIFRSDSKIDMAAFNEGREPEADDEIAIDRMHADNVGVKIGDTIKVGGKEFKVVGFVSYVEYLTLHKNNTDLMFDAFGFDVAMVTPSAFDKLKTRIHYSYAYKYVNAPVDKPEKKVYAENFLKALITQTLVYDNEIEDYIPEYLRQGSNFATSDIEKDSAGSAILCYILIAVIAFIFAITISNTIDKEASVIGTLRASGYSKKELIVHYMTMPVIVTILGAIIGNVLGYTVFKDIAVGLYYNSYSMPNCSAVFSETAIVKTTVIPLILMFVINLIVIIKKLQLSPLKFLRHDLSKNKNRKARRLPNWAFLRRFRLRVFFQNLPNYAVLVFGVIFIELMLCFAFGLPDSLYHYEEKAPDMMFADYQYMLTSTENDDGDLIVTSEKTAEKFSAKELLYPKDAPEIFAGMGSGGDEGVTVYGIEENSHYITFDKKLSEGEVYVSVSFMKKFNLKEGQTITLHEEYENRSYDFKVVGIIDYEGGIAVFMGNDAFNKTFEKDEDEFTGYFADNEIKDIDEKYIAAVITSEEVIAVTNQLKHSMGGAMNVFKYALIVMTAALIYLLAKIIIERNEQAISMAKILGFKNGEIASLYILPTAIVVLFCTAVGFVAGYYIMIWIFKLFMLCMDGYFAFYMSVPSMGLSMLYLLIGYAFVSIIDFIRIKHIPMDMALKNVE